MNEKTEIAVLGAGIIGLCNALQLQREGFQVTLIDRAIAPGLETSFGNAGLIQPDGFLPILFPRDVRSILEYASNRRRDCVYQTSALWQLAPTLVRYWHKSSPASARRTMAANIPLFAASVDAHMELAELAGASEQFSPKGWTRVFTNEVSFRVYAAKISGLKSHGVSADILSPAEISRLEPDLLAKPVGAVRLIDQLSLSSPLKLSEAYFRLFLKNGGQFARADATSLTVHPDGNYSVRTENGSVTADKIVVCLGPWADDLLRRFGIKIPLFVKRGYAVHFNAQPGAQLHHSTSDADGGYSITPMEEGIRLNTGVEFASRDAPASDVQLARVIPLARKFFPLGEQIDVNPWVGSRPCLPDMLPVIGESAHRRGLWFAFGHAHHGLTLAAASGRLLAQMVKGLRPFTDPTPYSAERFA
ncbi:NAD(P)/FAD-dependent oxidoreductase [Agrobacterium pusense]|uniref:FAD-binding oxidoreductase n=3 Tax=Agrobacterium pusense TaxID=648995 RepID=A0AA44EH00_9HYPH|nr:FAD-binding oxidoreductase [Agrobacterium pusense]MDH0873374.1 FAD-binding oxidoreductase [Agrobacterium pusense]NRF07746.1 FAD-binding oxidoreductase [Agrobacterium pusense]NRF18043.1 FAD-binding oxidoreductase [Agrobacterium pusense]